MRIFPTNGQGLVYLDVLTGFYASTTQDTLVRIVTIKGIGIVDLVRFGAERCLLMLNLQQFRRVMNSAVPIIIVANGAVEKMVTQDPVERFPLSGLYPN